MKTLIKNSLVTIAMLGVITSYANLKTPMLDDESKKTVLTLENVRQGQRILIKSNNGTILFKEAIDTTGFYKKEFDLTSLPNGDYYFEVDKDFEIKIILFTVKDTEVNFLKEDTKSAFKPVVVNDANVLKISKLALHNELLEVKIYFYNGNYQLIHEEELSGSKNIQKVYRLLEKNTGNYKVVCKTEGREFATYFKV